MLIPSMIVILAFADSSSDSSAAADRARQAWARQQYAEAQAGFHTAAEDARAAANDSAALEYTRLEAAVQRDSGNAAAAEVLLAGTGGDFAKAHGENAPELAAIWEDMALLERFQGHPEAAAPLLEKAIAIREPHPDPALARDITAEAMLQGQLGHHDLVIDLLKHAVAVWDTASSGDPQSLAALDALAAAYRDQSRYDDAEPLLERSLRMREALFGPDSADLISAVDSLAYVQFGRGRLPEAEALYDRLLALWQKNAAPNHPMVALTLDKMAELYAFQQKYARAQEFAQRALDLRTGAEIASLNQSGRLLIIQGKVGEAADLYRRTVQAGDLMKAPDEVMDPPLRVYATILRQLRREREARVVDRRITDALLHSADRDGRREPPPMPGTSTATPSTPAGHE